MQQSARSDQQKRNFSVRLKSVPDSVMPPEQVKPIKLPTLQDLRRDYNARLHERLTAQQVADATGVTIVTYRVAEIGGYVDVDDRAKILSGFSRLIQQKVIIEDISMLQQPFRLQQKGRK